MQPNGSAQRQRAKPKPWIEKAEWHVQSKQPFAFRKEQRQSAPGVLFSPYHTIWHFQASKEFSQLFHKRIKSRQISFSRCRRLDTTPQVELQILKNRGIREREFHFVRIQYLKIQDFVPVKTKLLQAKSHLI